MTDLNLSAALTPIQTDATSFTVEIPTGWEQGKGAYGGLVLGMLVRAVELTEPDPQRIVRSLAAEIPAPVMPGPARIVIEPLRRGGAVSVHRRHGAPAAPAGGGAGGGLRILFVQGAVAVVVALDLISQICRLRTPDVRKQLLFV